MEATAKVIPLTSKATVEKERAMLGLIEAVAAQAPQFGALNDVVVRIPDEQLEAFATIFRSSPLRRAMTFEGYLITKGYGDSVE
jgi:predicted alternative tryptophan synthase beta-subunit